MTTVDWNHIILAASGYSGTSRRIARMRNAGAHFAPPYRADHWSGDNWSPRTTAAGQAPTSYSPPFSPLPPDNPYGALTYVFTMWSVTGSSPIGTPLREVYDERTPSPGGGPWTLNATAWYAWDWNSGGKDGGLGEPVVEIDAFSRTNRDFIPDYFVDINPDGEPDPAHSNLGPLTYMANEDGYIHTGELKDPITITAREVIGDSYVRYQFVEWQVISRFTSGSPMPVDNGNSITIHPQNTLKANAIYDVAEVNIPEVEIVPSSYALYDRAGRPFLVIGPLGDPQPPLPLEDVRRIAEMMQRAEKDLHKLYEF